MRSLLVVVGTIVVILALASSGTVTGNVCLKHVGCAHATGAGFSLDGSGP